MCKNCQVNVTSEIGQLQGVIIHSPGPEIENMIPKNVERALYSDILNLSVAGHEYEQFSSALSHITSVYEVKDLLRDVLLNEKVKARLVKKICNYEQVDYIIPELMEFSADQLAAGLLEGVIMHKDTLTKYLDTNRYSLRPLHNFFFMRDASVSVFDNVLISSMANKIRMRESIIMEAIFDYHPKFSTKTINPGNLPGKSPELKIEGGDVLIARDDILVIGIGVRTTSQGIDYIIEQFGQTREKLNIIVQELPHEPESFIHLDMVFTFLDKDKCMIYEPVVLNANRYRTIHISIENGEVRKIEEKENILESLKSLGMELEPVFCGGTQDSYIQEREQWHSGANFFALGPGRVIGYERNVYTIEELSRKGFEVVKAKDIMKEKVDINEIEKYVITIHGSELSRGGGGCRCMTMPVLRSPVEW